MFVASSKRERNSYRKVLYARFAPFVRSGPFWPSDQGAGAFGITSIGSAGPSEPGG